MVRGKEKKRVRWWQGRRRRGLPLLSSSNDEEEDGSGELGAPLLPTNGNHENDIVASALRGPSHHATEEATAATNALGTTQRRRVRPHSHALASSIGQRRRRRSSSSIFASSQRRRRSISADRRRRRMTKHIARHMSGGRGRQASGESSSGSVLFDYDDDDDAISTTGSEETRRIGNCIAHRSDSEMTYYESEDDALLLLPPKQMSPGEMARVTSVVLITVIGSVCYLGSFVAFAMGASSSVAGLTTLGVAGGVTVLTVPFVWVSEWRLTRMHAMRKRVNEFRQLTKTFQEEVEILILEEESLRDELEVLKHDNKRLEQLVKIENGGNVSEVVELVHENQRILRQMRENIRQVVLQDVVKLVLQSDIDRNGVIDRKEADILARRLTISLDVYGIVFDEVKFHRAVGLSPSVGGVMAIVRRLLPNYDLDDDNGRMMSSSSFYSTGSDDDDDEEVYGGEEDHDDMYDMYYIPLEGQFDRGDADSIQLCKEYQARRGEKAKLMSISPSLTRSVKGLYCSVSSRD